ncbi:MAG: hypothetical protein Q8L84_17130 [Hyphomonas sp.]|nr:hypothetical protein [Hyphomonas sp.]
MAADTLLSEISFFAVIAAAFVALLTSRVAHLAGLVQGYIEERGTLRYAGLESGDVEKSAFAGKALVELETGTSQARRVARVTLHS